MKRVASNFLSIIGGDIARRTLGFLTIAYLVRTITVADFGAINIGFTILSYAIMMSAGGLNTFGAREVARGVPIQYINAIVSLRLVAAALIYSLVCLGVVLILPSGMLAKLIMLFSLSVFAHALLLEWYFQGKEEMAIIGTGRLVSAATYLALTVMFVHSSADLLLVAMATVAADALAASILLLFFRKRNRGVLFHFTTDGWKSFLARAIPVGAGSILAHMCINLPPLVIGIVLTNTDVGMYSSASKMVFFLLMLDRVLATLLLPASSRLHALSPDALSSTLNAALRWILLIALPICTGGTLLADRLILPVFGEQYLASIVVFQVLIWYMLFTMVHTIYTSGIVAIGKERQFSRVMMMSAVIYGISVLVCTKLFGIIGAAAAVVGSEAATLILMRHAFQQSVKTSLPRSLPIILVAVCVMGAILLFLPPMHLVLSVLIGAGVYAAMIVTTRTVTLGDLMSLVRRV